MWPFLIGVLVGYLIGFINADFRSFLRIRRLETINHILMSMTTMTALSERGSRERKS
jgi:NhaP-type Na+/H+ or K+/H+ antiporter